MNKLSIISTITHASNIEGTSRQLHMESAQHVSLATTVASIGCHPATNEPPQSLTAGKGGMHVPKRLRANANASKYNNYTEATK